MAWCSHHITHLICRYENEAVSVRRGGITAKLPQWRLNKRKWLLAVEDPQVSCRFVVREKSC